MDLDYVTVLPLSWSVSLIRYVTKVIIFCHTHGLLVVCNQRHSEQAVTD